MVWHIAEWSERIPKLCFIRLSAGVRMSQTAFCIMVVLSIIALGEATTQNFLSDGARARGGRVASEVHALLEETVGAMSRPLQREGYHRDNRSLP